MLKAVFLDLDETLCDTTGANRQALVFMAATFRERFGGLLDDRQFVAAYLKGIYRELDERYARLLLPVTDEAAFRLQLIQLILQDMGIAEPLAADIRALQDTFDTARSQCFSFFPGIRELLADLRQRFILVVITNGPEFSQLAKINAVKLHEHVDHIIIGGQEPAEKPSPGIFEKALTLAQCRKDEAIHIGDSLKADVAGANNSGIVSVWISHGNELPADSAIRPVHTIENPFQIRDLIALLEHQFSQR